ncbi:oleate activated transcription factor 3 [Parachaetomium inaequale]|uniref:Oleate activated transcription factor 3 n=1 Tax=Parachaetomium inaequale TaxID=2588326 RepID=A0AAN6PPE4_9PEZI|nr:oleate activated transcription factor 3 [Parachaetomium inaequale]
MASRSSPAGYFSTFSLFDPNRSTLGGQSRPQKRNRRVAVCIPCHRRKLKCDKGQPCSRCVLSKMPDECVYQQLPAGARRGTSTEPRGTPPQSAHSSPQTAAASISVEAKPRVDGVTYWRTIAFEFQEPWPYISGTDPAGEPAYRQLQSHKYLFTSLSVVDLLIRAYFQTLNPVYHLFHFPQFEEELNAIWVNSSQCSEEWGIGQCMEGWTERLLDAAQFFCSKSLYLSAPTLTSVRALCLVVIARLLDLKGAETSQLASLAGFLSRSAVVIHLHRSSSVLPELTPFEAEMRRRVWVADGTSYIHEDHDPIIPLNINDADIYRTRHGWMVGRQQAQQQEVTDSAFQVTLAELLPTLIEIINTVNSPTKPPPTYDKVQSWDSQLRQHLRDAKSALSPSHQGPAAVPLDTTKKTQLDFLRLLTHHAVLALHHHHHPDYTCTILQSSLEILRIQSGARRQPPPPSSMPNPDDPRTRTQPPQATGPPRLSSSTIINTPAQRPLATEAWLLDLHCDTFTAALLYYILSLRQLSLNQIPTTQIPIPRQQQQQQQKTTTITPPSLSPEQHALILQQSLEVFRGRAGRSAGQFEEFVAVAVARGCWRVLFSSSSSSSSFSFSTSSSGGVGVGVGGQQQQQMMGVLLGVAEQVEQVEQAVLGGRQGGRAGARGAVGW